MSKCSSLPPLSGQNLHRVSASRHGKTSNPPRPIFKDGYLYHNIKSFRNLADTARFYTRERASHQIRPDGMSINAWRKVKARVHKSRKLHQWNGQPLPHNGFHSDPHTYYLARQYAPTSNPPRTQLLRQPPSDAFKKAPKFEELSERVHGYAGPPRLSVFYTRGNKGFKTAYKGQKFTDNLRADRYLEKYGTRHGLQQTGAPFVFTGPASNYNTLDKLNFLLRDWRSPDTRLDRKILNKAVQKTIDEFKDVAIRPMSYNRIISSRQFLKNRRHDTGFSGPGFRDKFELANNPSFRAFADKWHSSGKPATYKLFWKTEALKKDKARLLPRAILGTSLESELSERRSFQPFIASLKHSRWNTPSKIGIKNQEFPRLYDHHRFNQGWVANAIDFSFQDRAMPKAIMQARKEVLLGIGQHQNLDRDSLHAIARISDQTSKFYVVSPTGEVFLLESGHPTGLYLGAEGNTLNHRIIHNYLDIKHGFDTMQKIDSQYGDDALRSLPRDTPQTARYLASKNTIFKTVEKDLGLKTTIDVWGQHPLDTKEEIFLRRGFENRKGSSDKNAVIPVFNHDRVLNKWLVPHVGIHSPQESFNRSLGYLFLTGGQPALYDTIHGYMTHLLTKHSEVTAPKVFSKMSQPSLVKDYYTPKGKEDPSARRFVDYETFVHTSHQGGFPIAIGIPSGEGKTSLSRTDPRHFIDHDRLIDKAGVRAHLNQLTKQAKEDNNWNEVNSLVRSVVPENDSRILLTWNRDTTPKDRLYAGSYLLDRPTGTRENLPNREAILHDSRQLNDVFFFKDYASRNKYLTEQLAHEHTAHTRHPSNRWNAFDRYYLEPRFQHDHPPTPNLPDPELYDAHRLLLLSGDVEENPGPLDKFIKLAYAWKREQFISRALKHCANIKSARQARLDRFSRGDFTMTEMREHSYSLIFNKHKRLFNPYAVVENFRVKTNKFSHYERNTTEGTFVHYVRSNLALKKLSGSTLSFIKVKTHRPRRSSIPMVSSTLNAKPPNLFARILNNMASWFCTNILSLSVQCLQESPYSIPRTECGCTEHHFCNYTVPIPVYHRPTVQFTDIRTSYVRDEEGKKIRSDEGELAKVLDYKPHQLTRNDWEFNLVLTEHQCLSSVLVYLRHEKGPEQSVWILNNNKYSNVSVESFNIERTTTRRCRYRYCEALTSCPQVYCDTCMIRYHGQRSRKRINNDPLLETLHFEYDLIYVPHLVSLFGSSDPIAPPTPPPLTAWDVSHPTNETLTAFLSEVLYYGKVPAVVETHCRLCFKELNRCAHRQSPELFKKIVIKTPASFDIRKAVKHALRKFDY